MPKKRETVLQILVVYSIVQVDSGTCYVETVSTLNLRPALPNEGLEGLVL